MKLSEAYKAFERPSKYAACDRCRLAWVDDIPLLGSLECPQPGCGFALLRGVDDPGKMGCRLVEDDEDPLKAFNGIFSNQDDPGKQVKNIATPRRSR